MSRQAENWIDLGVWGSGMDENKLPATGELAGREFTLRFQESDETVACKFLDATSLTWATSNTREQPAAERETYEAIRVRPDIYFVDFIPVKKPNDSVSMVLNVEAGYATVLTATLPDQETASRSFVGRLGKGVDLSTVRVKTRHAVLLPSLPSDSIHIHPHTSDLVGERITYTYGVERVYEHIYLNDRLYTWHCLKGPEKGLADTEACDYFKIAPDLYLFSWREKIMPTFGMVVIDLKNMRSNGKTFGLDIATGQGMNFTMGAIAEPHRG